MAGHGDVATSVSLAAVMAEQARAPGQDRRRPHPRGRIRWAVDGNCRLQLVGRVQLDGASELIKDFLRTFFDPEVYLKYSQTTYRGWLPVLLPTQQDPEFFNHPRIAPYADYFKVALEVSPGSVSIGQEYGSNMYGGLVDAEGVYKGIVEGSAEQLADGESRPVGGRPGERNRRELLIRLVRARPDG